MKFSQKKLPKSQVEIRIDILPEEVEACREEAVKIASSGIETPGFRPGHIPSHIAEEKLGKERIFREMAQLAIRNAYIKALEDSNLDVVGEPHIEVMKLAPGNPVEIRVTVAVVPEVQVPDYKQVASQAKRRAVSVEDKEVQDALGWLRESRKKEGLEVPELSDEFAKSLGGFEGLTALKASIKEGLRHEKETQETERLRQEILENITEKAKAEIPDLLIEREKAVLMENMKKGVADVLQIGFEEYLQKAGKSEQELSDSLLEEAANRVKKFLVLREVAQKENISSTKEEVEEEANRILAHYKDANTAAKDIDPERLKEYTEGVMRHEKTLQFLESFAQKS